MGKYCDNRIDFYIHKDKDALFKNNNNWNFYPTIWGN